MHIRPQAVYNLGDYHEIIEATYGLIMTCTAISPDLDAHGAIDSAGLLANIHTIIVSRLARSLRRLKTDNVDVTRFDSKIDNRMSRGPRRHGS